MTEAERSDDVCAICLCCMKDNLTRLSCGHFFHTACYEKQMSTSHTETCPLCRGEDKPNDDVILNIFEERLQKIPQLELQITGMEYWCDDSVRAIYAKLCIHFGKYVKYRDHLRKALVSYQDEEL